MTYDELVFAIEQCERELTRMKVPKRPLDKEKSLLTANHAQIKAHAHYLCDGAKKLAQHPEKMHLALWYLGFIQACMSATCSWPIEKIQSDNRGPQVETAA